MARTQRRRSRQSTGSQAVSGKLRCPAEGGEAGGSKGRVITISRQMGSGGRTIGRLVANELKYAYYDKEIIERLAAETGSDEHHIAQHEKHPRDPVTGLLISLIDRREVTDTVYLRHLLRVFRRIDEEGRAVVIGRGGSCALSSSLKVRLIAPFELRVERMGELQHVDV